MELIDAILYVLLLSGWFCGGLMASMTGIGIFTPLGIAVSVVALVILGAKSISQMGRGKREENQ